MNRVKRVSDKVIINHASDEAAQAEKLANVMLRRVFILLNHHQIIPDAVQVQMLTSHLRAMAQRSVTGEPLPDVDASLFDDISMDSMLLAREVVAQFGNLPDEEAWLLSVHFEVAKENR